MLDKIRNRGFEINVHDLKHDGRLFSDHAEFLGLGTGYDVDIARYNFLSPELVAGVGRLREGASRRPQERLVLW